MASDYDYTIRPKAGTKLTVKLSEVTLPIVNNSIKSLPYSKLFIF